MVTVDAVVFRKNGTSTEVLLIKRGHYPYEGMWALPGGFVDMEETLEEAVCRELKEETGWQDRLEQLHAFSDIHRDPRGRNISIIFWGIAGLDNPSVKVAMMPPMPSGLPSINCQGWHSTTAR